jgi:hypothetical protein
VADSYSGAVSRKGARAAINHAASRSAPMLVTAALALAGALDLLPLPIGETPVRIGLVILVQAVAIGLSGVLDRPGPRTYWQMALGATLIALPVIALQAFVSRMPFVAISRGSAGPLLWLTFVAVVVLGGLWIFAAYQSDETPENGALFFLPAAVLVPAVLGAPGTLGETSALEMLGEASFVAGVAIFLGLLSPENMRPVLGGATLGVQFALLWALGRGPVLGHDAGRVVPVCAAVLLTVTALLTVMTPLAALFSRRFFQAVEEESGGLNPISVPPRGARRSDDR